MSTTLQQALPIHTRARSLDPSVSLRSAFALAARVLIVAMFLPAGIGKLTGFSGTVGYIASAGLLLPAAGAALALAVEILGSLALLAGFGTRVAALVLDRKSVV